ncbi:MAG: NACHT domain-containing protein, partial [Gammaproteobacteria bacterium]|nr:NACHT domain-containing protein [Gammaproteobacteria bacterium]
MSYLPVDFAIITALEEELDAVLHRLDGCKKIQEDDEPLTYYYGRINLTEHDGHYVVVAVRLLDMGNDEAAIATTRIIHRWKPAYLLMAGIAGGVPGKIKLGDVAIAKSCYYYPPAKQTPDGTKYLSQQFQSDRMLYGRARDYDKNDWQADINVVPPNKDCFPPAVKYGLIASGEEVIADETVLQNLLDKHGKIIAAAMEGAGMARAALNDNSSKPGFLEIRGISDYANADKNDDWHHFAAEAAAAFTIRFLRSGPVQPLSPIKPAEKSKPSSETERALQFHPAWRDSGLDVLQCINHLARRYQSDSDTFTPLFLRADAENLPSINVIPATLLWSHRGPIEDMPDGQLDVTADTEGKATPLTEVVDKHPILVLRGDPGTGKTTSCRFLVHRLARVFGTVRESEGIAPLPVFVELKRFRMNSGEEADDALARLTTSALRENGALPPDYQPDAVDGQRWLARAEQAQPLALYFDGLNEVPPVFKDAAETALKQLAEHLRGTHSRMVITTRRYGFETWRLNLKVYDLQPLKADAIKHYLQRQLGWEAERIETLYEKQLGARLRLQASNPLLLNLLCDVLRQQPDQAPASRGELFQLFVQGMLERWEKNVKDSDYGQRNFSPKEKQQALERLAFHMQTGGRVASVPETLTLFTEILRIPQEQAAALLEEICVNHLLVKRGDKVEFAHHTLQEYFCASALYHRWKNEPTPGQVEWTPDFQQALDDPHWWEPLAMAGGLFYRDELGNLVKQIEDKPILTGMLLGNARPETPGEHHFLRHAAEKTKAGIWRSILLTQTALLGMTAVCAAIAAGALWLETQDGLTLLLSFLGVNPLHGLPVFMGGTGLAIGGFILAIFLMLRTTDFIRAQHDKLLDSCYARWIEPWLLALFYTNSERAEQRLEKLLGEYGSRRFVDESLRARLRAFTSRALNQDVDALLAQLDEPDKQATAVSILALEFDPALAHNLLQTWSSRSATRQQAEIMLYQAWVQRHEPARISGKSESFLHVLESQVKDRDHDYALRRRLANALRQSGWSKAKVEWNFAWLNTLGRSLLKVPSFATNSILSLFTVVPFYLS